MRQHRSPRPAARLQVPGWGHLAGIVATVALLGGCQPKDDFAAAGQQYLKDGKYTEAVIQFKNAVQAEPDSAATRALLADALERVYDLPGAEQELRKALAAGGDEQLALRIAVIQLDRSDFDALVREFKDRRLADRQADSTLRALVAIAYVGLKQPALAQRQLQDVADTPAVKLARAQLLVADGKLAEALALLPPPNATAPADTPWWVLRATGRLASAVGDEARALESVRLAHVAVPWHQGVTGEYGEALLNAGKTEEATAVRDQLRKQAPNYFWTHYLDAALLARAGKIDQGHAAALKALAMAPQHLPSGLIAASAELSKGDFLMADRRLHALVQENPNSLQALRMLVESKMRSGKRNEAVAVVARGLSVAPQDAQLLAVKADLEWSLGARKDAMATLTKLTAAHPDDVLAKVRLAEARGRMGDKPQATRMLDETATAAGQDTGLRGRIVATALRLGYLDQARRIAEQGLALQPQLADASLALAAVQSAQNDAAGAWRTTLQVLDREPAHAGALSALSAMVRTPAQQNELLGRYAKALETGKADAQTHLQYAAVLRSAPATAGTPVSILERGLTAWPEALNLREALVEEHFRAGNNDKALATAQAGTTQDSSSAQAMLVLAAAQERVGQSAQALEIYRKLRTAHPHRADLRLKLAGLEAEAGNRTEAITLLRNLLKERPSDVAVYLQLASLELQNNATEALSIARQMGDQPELKGAAMLLEGDILAQTGKKDEAILQFGKASRIGMEPAATLRIVRTLDSAGRASAGDDELAAALRRYPDDTAVLGFAAQRALDTGRAARAVELLQRLVAAAPGNPVVLNDLAWAQVQAGHADALANSRRAAAMLPNNPNVLDTLGMAQAKAGRRDEAIATLRAASNLAPLAALPRLHLSELLLASGDRPGALAALQPIDAKRLDEREKASFAKLKSELERPGT